MGADVCQAPANGSPGAWLPTTPMPTSSYNKPPTHAEGGGDCPFYIAAWQTFLYVSQPQAYGPAFTHYASIGDVFGSKFMSKFLTQSRKRSGASKEQKMFLLPRSEKGPNDGTPANGGIEQAGFKGILVDQTGNPIFYGIHMNERMANFIADNELGDATKARNASSALEYPRGAVELKSAWMTADKVDPKQYFIVRAIIPRLKVIGGVVKLDPSGGTRETTLALIALHVVFVMEGHPEFVWSTFEHVDGSGTFDNAPSGPANDEKVAPNTVISTKSYTLFKAGSTKNAANLQLDDSVVSGAFDEGSQIFRAPAMASVYRAYPASKSVDESEDEDIASLNKSVASAFSALAATGGKDDIRSHYKLVGAVWLNTPDKFVEDRKFENPSGVDPDSAEALISGEDRLSSTSMESFTQTDSHHCFKCHDTKHVTDVQPALDAKRLNVSHIISTYLRDSGQ